MSEKLITPLERDLSVQLLKVPVERPYFTIEYIKPFLSKQQKRKIKPSWNYADFTPSTSFAFSVLEAHVHSTVLSRQDPKRAELPLCHSRAVLHVTVSRGFWHMLRCEHPTTVELKNDPTPLEVEKLRHRRVK